MAEIRKYRKRAAIDRFPAKPRRDGRWQKRIRGTLHYFHDTRAQAMADYEQVKHDLYAGRIEKPAQVDDSVITIGEIATRFLNEQRAEAKSGRMSDDWHRQCVRAIKRFSKKINKAKAIAELCPEDFAAYGRWLSQQVGDNTYNRERSSIIAMLRYASNCDWIERPVKIGMKFRKVPAATIREKRQSRLVPSSTIKAMLAATIENVQLHTIILLAINGGMGAKDCGRLAWDKIDLDAGIIRNYRRHKTKINRDVPLWYMTTIALRILRAKRPADTHVFRTKHGNLWTGIAIAHRLAKFIDKINASRKDKPPIDLVLGDLRHTFATYANETVDTDAVKRIMGHRLLGLKEIYVETLFIPRLRAVTEHVYLRVFSNPPETQSNP